MLGNFSCFVVVCKSTFSKNSFRNTIRVSNSLHPDQDWHWSGSKLFAKVKFHLFFSRLSSDFFQDQLFWKILSGTLSECQTACIQIRIDIDLGPNCLQRLNFTFFLSFVILFFSRSTFSKSSFRNTIRVSNSLDPNKNLHFVGPDLVPNCLQKLSDDKVFWGIFSCFFVVCWLFSKSTFSKKSFRNTIRVSNGLDPGRSWFGSKLFAKVISRGLLRPNKKKISVFRVTGLKISGRVCSHIYIYIFFLGGGVGEIYNFMHLNFKLPFKMHKMICLPSKMHEKLYFNFFF